MSRTTWTVNQSRLTDLIGVRGDRPPSPVLAALTATRHPDYEVEQVIDSVPFKEAFERLSDQVGRLYFREQNHVYAMTVSAHGLRILARQILAAFEEPAPTPAPRRTRKKESR